jgi:hypothetical protein
MIRSISWAEHVAHMGKQYKVSVGKPEEKRPLGIPRYKWEDNIRIAPKKKQHGRAYTELSG